MDKLITAILFIGIPMALTQLIYRIIDRKGNKTAKLAERFPVLVKRKFLVQIGGAMAFVIVFGLISLLLDLPIKVFFIVCGVVVGVINGMAVTLMYRDESVATWQLGQNKGAVKKSATKPVDFLDMEVHGL